MIEDTILADYMEEVIMLDRRTVPSSYGGFVVQYVEGASFSGAITPDESLTAQIAQASTEIKRYRLTTAENITLQIGDYIRRTADGETFKVLHSNTDKLTPNDSAIPMRSTTIEKVTLPL